MCINPKYATFTYKQELDRETGEIKLKKRIRFLDIQPIPSIERFIQENTKNYTPAPLKEGVITIPCGKCEQCRISKANDWTTRAVLESKQYKNNAFVTLTYDNKNISKNRSLHKRDLQLFWKRLRKSGENIRYMACGEYGRQTLRPHYHAIIFNYWPKDVKFYKWNDEHQPLYTSKELNKIWGLGYVIIGRATYESMAYTARYVFKKSYGITNDLHIKHNREPEFILTSRKGGIGINALKQIDILKDGIPIKTSNGVKIKELPTFIRNKWKEKDTEEYFKWSDNHARELKAITRARIKNTSKNIFEIQKDQNEKIHKQLIRLDKRDQIY